MGKTTFALNIAEYAAIKSKKGVAVFAWKCRHRSWRCA